MTTEKIESAIKSILEHLSVPAPTIEIVEEANSWRIMIRTQDDRPLVGHDGERFEAFSHLMKRVLSKKIKALPPMYGKKIDVETMSGTKGTKNRASLAPQTQIILN